MKISNQKYTITGGKLIILRNSSQIQSTLENIYIRVLIWKNGSQNPEKSGRFEGGIDRRGVFTVITPDNSKKSKKYSTLK